MDISLVGKIVLFTMCWNCALPDSILKTRNESLGHRCLTLYLETMVHVTERFGDYDWIG